STLGGLVSRLNYATKPFMFIKQFHNDTTVVLSHLLVIESFTFTEPRITGINHGCSSQMAVIS
ncbi:hypothetical protein, partial [Vibrio parahaemolyticus]|uniref:hypothetical protein n=1 Tax=Vibrio parahaemolyticus TaxID=670 RepID=UPI001EDA06DB